MKKYLHFIIMIAIVLAASTLVFAQFPFFTGPGDQETCTTAGVPVNFDVNYINDPTLPVPVVDFTFASTDVTIALTPPPFFSGGTFSVGSTGSSSGASYTLFITNVTNPITGTLIDYEVRLSITSGILSSMDGLTYSCTANNGMGTTSNSGALEVNTPISIFIDDPIALSLVACEGEDVTIDASTSSIPVSYQWVRNGNTVVGNAEDLTLNNVMTAQSGTYELEIMKPGCPIVISDPVVVGIVPSVVLTETDMAAKELLPGGTASFTAQAENVDNSSTYTWCVGSGPGTSFTAADVPTTVVIDGNTIQIASIANTSLGPTSTETKITLNNLSAPGAPAFTAPVRLKVSNNTACIAETASILSGESSIFPVEWSYFNGRFNSELEVELEWETETEQHNDKFVIERSLDGIRFESIGAVAGAGNSTTPRYYEWKDVLPYEAVSLVYYRIQQIDFSGYSSYSSVIALSRTIKPDWSLGPVVINGQEASIAVANALETTADFRLFDARGVLIESGEVHLGSVEGGFSFHLPTTKGVYFIQVLIKGKQQTLKFIHL